MKKLTILLLVAVGLGQAFLDQPDFSKVGMSGAQFLKIPTSARIVGLGGAFVAVANDVSTVFVNPAGMRNINNTGFSVSEVNWIADINYTTLGFVKSTGYNSFGFQMSALTMGKIKRTTYTDPDGETSGDFSAYDIMLGGSYARSMTDKLDVGVTMKYVKEVISNMSASALAFDLGTYYKTGFRTLVIGMAMHNYSTAMQFQGQDLKVPDIPEQWVDSFAYNGGPLPLLLETSEYSMPLNFGIGVAYTFTPGAKTSILTTAEVVHPNDGLEKFMIGAEFTHNKMFSLRVGYKLDPDKFYDKKSSLENLAAGFGAKFNVGSAIFQFDYGFLNNGRLGYNHFFTVQYLF